MKDAPTLRTLVLGCGNRPYRNATNHDVTPHSDYVDVVHNLSVLPWPFVDEQFDFVIAESVLEHLDIDLLTAMNEIWRILQPGGKLSIKLPYWRHEQTWNDPTHRRGYGLGIFRQFDPTTERGREYEFYTARKWHILKPARLNPSGSSVLAVLEKVP